MKIDDHFIELLSKMEIPKQVKKENFLQIINANKIESVSTQILGLIFDSHKNHGLGAIPLQALFNVLDIKVKIPKLSSTKVETSCFYQKKNNSVELI